MSSDGKSSCLGKEDEHDPTEEAKLDELGSVACQAIMATLGAIDFNWDLNPDQLKETEEELRQEEKRAAEERAKKPVIKLKYKRLFKVMGNQKKENYPIVLHDSQSLHRDRLLEILDISPFVFDFSMMGTGKTYVSSDIYQKGDYSHLVCIVPSSVKTKWQYMYLNHGVDLDVLVSYSELRSTKFKQPKHGLLVRRDTTRTIRRSDGTSRAVDTCQFQVTEKYLNRVKNGLFLVIDEIQNIKNTNDQLMACKELVKPILDRYAEEQAVINHYGKLPDNFKKSRIILLSGSPMDKKSQVIHFYRCLGIMKSEKLRVYNPYTGVKHDQGISEIRRYFQKHFPEQYQNYCINYYYGLYSLYHSDETVMDLEKRCYSLFQKILKPELSSSMDPITNNYHLEQYNGFFKMEHDDHQLLIKGIEHLERATNYDDQLRTIDFGVNGVDALRNIQRALVMIETSKINLLVRLAKMKLDANPQQKVVIAVNYRDTIDDLLFLLQSYNPLRLSGEVSHKKRYEILEEFQRSNGDHRLLIGNMTVMSTGIDLDDTNGHWPRVAFVNPNYSAISLYQFGYRFHRVHTRSNSEVYFVFGDGLKTELPILDSLAKKGEVLGETCEKQREAGIKFPGNFPSYYEK